MSRKFSPHLLTCICGSKRIHGELGVKQLDPFLFVSSFLLQPLLLFAGSLEQSLQPHENTAQPAHVSWFYCQGSVADRRSVTLPKGCCSPNSPFQGRLHRVKDQGRQALSTLPGPFHRAAYSARVASVTTVQKGSNFKLNIIF